MLKERIKEISKKHGLSHNGSNLTAVDIIADIYHKMKPEDIFILSSGHAGLALYCVLEMIYGTSAEMLYKKHGTHPNRDLKNNIYCSTGSLGCGLGIAVGMALASPQKQVYCLISDGETFEGVIFEAANLLRKYNPKNIHVYLNWNGYSATDIVNSEHIGRIKVLFGEYLTIYQTNVSDYGFTGLEAHYQKL